jgi:PAS domain S-box-containing protein
MEFFMQKKPKTLEALEQVAPILPTPLYWEDSNSVILGCNETALKVSGALIREAFIDKTPHELYPKEMADHIKQHNAEVMHTGKILSQEEMIRDITTGEIKYFTAVKAPLHDNDGNIIGIIGTSIDITEKKEAERLKFQAYEKFTNLANQVAHDIRSPLASLLMIVKSCTQIPEADRIALREAAVGIGDIANHLLNQYEKKEIDEIESEERLPILVSATLLESLTAKKYQYQKLPIKFDCSFQSNTHFVFIKTEVSAFKRMLSNLMNNGVDAFDNQPGKIDLRLEADNEWVNIIIQDTGNGMSPELINKIMNRTSVSEGKKSGHGIGLTQVWETLDRNQGEMHIISELGKGTTITLTFPRIKAPRWIAEEIALCPNDTILILDDDSSIHGAWRTRFESILNENTGIQLKHFDMGVQALAYIQALPLAEQERIFLLSDYELLTQELNGLEIIAQSRLKRSMLVTSHYADPLVQAHAEKIGTKILPKQLASEVLIKITGCKNAVKVEDIIKKADAVIIDDDELFVSTLTRFIFRDLITDTYHNPEQFLECANKYAKGTKIYLDNNYKSSCLKGLDVAKMLHDRGYQCLYMLSGDIFEESDIPGYLTVVRKDDLKRLRSL